MLVAWPQDAALMKAQPDYISNQRHKGSAGSTTWLNYAIWQDVASFREAFTNTEFQTRIAGYPNSVTISPHLS